LTQSGHPTNGAEARICVGLSIVVDAVEGVKTP
jgi:hypothetical protein